MERDVSSTSVLANADAPAKLILLGEHSVVYGRPALAVPVDEVRARATVHEGEERLTLRSVSVDQEGGIEYEARLALAEAPEDDPLATAARAALAHAGLVDLPRWHVEISSTIPVSRGMGSSAAVAVALVRALAVAAGAEVDAEGVSALAYQAERVTHGSPSGIDNAVSALGRPILYGSGRWRIVDVRSALRLIIADTGPGPPTREMVEGVRTTCEMRPATCDRWFDQIGGLAEEGAAALAAGEISGLGRAMDSNHLLLQALRVSTARIDQVVAAARSAGAMGAKLSGAGGGGIVVALVDEESAPDVARAVAAAGAARVIPATIATCQPDREIE
jgi:mevalonate kinase